MTIIEVSDSAIQKLLEKKSQDNFEYIRIGITGGGCAGFEYIFDSVQAKEDTDVLVDYGPIQFVIDKISIPYILGINPKEEASCGCGVSINFDLSQVEHDEKRIQAISI